MKLKLFEHHTTNFSAGSCRQVLVGYEISVPVVTYLERSSTSDVLLRVPKTRIYIYWVVFGNVSFTPGTLTENDWTIEIHGLIFACYIGKTIGCC